MFHNDLIPECHLTVSSHRHFSVMFNSKYRCTLIANSFTSYYFVDEMLNMHVSIVLLIDECISVLLIMIRDRAVLGLLECQHRYLTYVSQMYVLTYADEATLSR